MEPFIYKYRDIVLEVIKKASVDKIITEDNVYQEGIPTNKKLIKKVINELMLPESRIIGFENLKKLYEYAIKGKSCLLLMEHFSNFDIPNIYELLERLKQEMTIVMVSHDISAVSIYVDKIACLNRQLFYHGSKEIEPEVLEATYKCPVQMIAHGTIPHRVLKEH